MQLNVLDDLAEAMKALDGKNNRPQFDIRKFGGGAYLLCCLEIP
jgi:hypothetical protein